MSFRLSFKPMPGLSLVTALSCLILIGLGTWQFQRLQWKTDLLTDIERASQAAPFSALSDVARALGNAEPVDFRRIDMVAEIRGNIPEFHVFVAKDNAIAWRPFVPVLQDGSTVFAALEAFPDSQKEARGVTAAATQNLRGYVRLARKPVWSATKSSPDVNRWFAFNPIPSTHDWGDRIPGYVDTRYYIDVASIPSADPLPVKVPDIRNNHFDYMLTWYGLALTLLFIYAVMHIKEGRLKFS